MTLIFSFLRELASPMLWATMLGAVVVLTLITMGGGLTPIALRIEELAESYRSR